MTDPLGQYPQNQDPYGYPAQPQQPAGQPGPYPPVQYPPVDQPYSAQPYSAQPYPTQPYSAPPAQPYSGAPYAAPAAQPYSGAPYGGVPYANAGVDPVSGRPLSDKSKVVAGLLQLLVGGFAVGRFYTGHVGMALGPLAAGWGVFFVLGCLGWVFPPFWLICWAGFAWPFIDGIVLLVQGGTDAQGRVLRS